MQEPTRKRRDAIEVINDKISQLPINQSELARMADMNPELLRRSLAGERKLSGDELVNLCEILGISMADFYTAA